MRAPAVLLLFAILCTPVFADPAARIGDDEVSPTLSVGARVAAAARDQVGVTKVYDPAYVSLKYPGGDVPPERGVCTDVVIRALRKLGIDLQKDVHEDMAANFSRYPKRWGLKSTDRNIDHRRVPNLMTYWKRQGLALPITERNSDYHPGDLVAWRLDNGLLHTGIVSERKGRSGAPRIIHNIGYGAVEEDRLFEFEVIGHYRLKELPAAGK